MSLAFSFSLLAAPAFAQDAGPWEIGLFGGGAFGTRVVFNPTTDIQIGTAFAYGIRGAYNFNRNLGLEVAFSHAQDTIRAKDRRTGLLLAPEAPIDATTIELDGVYTFGRRAARGYFSLGAGAMTLHPFVEEASV